jgi:tetratricopeptide (TPR) repeat protein
MHPGPPSTPQATVTLVTLATAWGPRFGGINAFNVEMTRSLGIHPDRVCDLICVVPQASTAEFDDARRHSVTLLVLAEGASGPGELPASLAPTVLRRLQSMQPQTSAFIWLGHDDKTGPLALALRAMALGSKAAVVHHMAFGAYQHHKKGDSAAAQTKREAQRAMFQQADLCLAVGPMLQDQLVDLMSGRPHAPPVAMLVPGLAEPDPDHVSLGQAPPKNFTAFLGGRLGSDDDRIKQALLGVRGFGHAVGQAFQGGQAHAIRNAPTLRMRGVPADQHADVSKACSAAAQGQVINFDLQDYTEDRNAYFADLATSSVALMPSWHEGFGLTAWEAIACRVPVVVGEQSGVYRLLKGQCQGAGIGRSVRAVPVQGSVHVEDGDAPPHTEQDVTALGDALHSIGSNMDENKADAVQLATILRTNHDFTWKRCATDLANAVERHLGVTLFEERKTRAHAAPVEAIGRPAATAAFKVSAFLQVPQPLAWRADQGAAPSALLVARHRVARFDKARDPLINDWLATLQSTGLSLTMRLVTGAGGTGKTRSALEFLQRAATLPDAKGWTGLWMPADLPADVLVYWQTFLANARGRFLLVVDYAEGRQTQLLRWLQAAHEVLANPATQVGALQVQVLCLARRGEWWNELHRSDACATEVAGLLMGPANLGVESMPDWPDDESARKRTYEDALTDYAAAQGLNRPANAWMPELNAAPYERPLYIHLAALAALAGERPAHAQALLSAQINREWRHWRQQIAHQGHLEIAYADWADAMAWLALVQGAPVAALGPALAALQISAPGIEIGLLKACSSYQEMLLPLQPDLLAEGLIVEQLSGKRGQRIVDLAFADQQAKVRDTLKVVSRLTVRLETPESAPETTQQIWEARILSGLATAWATHGNLMISGGHVLGQSLGRWLLPSWALLDSKTQNEIVPVLNFPRFSTPLLALGVTLSEALVLSADSQVGKANALSKLSLRLFQTGATVNRGRARQVGQQSVELARDLAQTQPLIGLPQLAVCLTNLLHVLPKGGGSELRALALAAASEAVRIFRQLVRADRVIYLPALAVSLGTHAVRLSESDDGESVSAALELLREAIDIRRPLVRDQPELHQPSLAYLLNNLADTLSKRGDPTSLIEALIAAREAVAHFRESVNRDAQSYLPDLATSLITLSNRLCVKNDVQSRFEALEVAQEAVQILRILSEVEPSAHRRDLALCLTALASRLSEKGDAAAHAEALSANREAVAIRRLLAKQMPEEFKPELAGSLNNLAACLTEQGNAELSFEAISAAREAVQIYREINSGEPPYYLANLAMCVGNLATFLFKGGLVELREEALYRSREAVAIWRRLVNQGFATHLPKLALALSNTSVQLLRDPQPMVRAEALHMAREAVSVFRALAVQLAALYQEPLSGALVNLARCLFQAGSEEARVESLEVVREAYVSYALLHAQLPEAVAGNFQIAEVNLTYIATAQGLNGAEECARLLDQLQRSAMRPK